MRIPTVLTTLALLAACAPGKESSTAERTADTMLPASGMMAADADRVTAGTGLPAGYVGRTDKADAKLEEARYSESGGRWIIETGPAHIVYAAKDTARGTYTASATIEQLETPKHPEAFGLIIGGQNLDQPSIKYTYFLVRGGGEYLVKVRDGADTRDVIAWKASPAVPKADSAGKATYTLAAKVANDSVRFMVNDKTVATVARSAIPTDGIVGLRVNHNLKVAAKPVRIT